MKPGIEIKHWNDLDTHVFYTKDTSMLSQLKTATVFSAQR